MITRTYRPGARLWSGPSIIGLIAISEWSLEMRVRNAVSLAWGIAIGCLTFAAGPISWTSANPIIAGVQWALLILIMPGIIGGGAVGGSMHTIFLGVAAPINALLHFGMCWLLFPLFSRSSLTKARI